MGFILPSLSMLFNNKQSTTNNLQNDWVSYRTCFIAYIQMIVDLVNSIIWLCYLQGGSKNLIDLMPIKLFNKTYRLNTLLFNLIINRWIFESMLRDRFVEKTKKTESFSWWKCSLVFLSLAIFYWAISIHSDCSLIQLIRFTTWL